MQRRPHTIPCLIAAAFLLGALARWPYGYYILLRWVTCGIAVYVALRAHEWGRTSWVWVFGGVAVLFNPIIRVHLTREIWQPINVVTALAFLVAAVALLGPPATSSVPDTNSTRAVTKAERRRILPWAVLAFLIISAILVLAVAWHGPSGDSGMQGIVHATRTGECYHRAGCRHLSRSDIPMTREKAERRGLRPCKVCRP